MIVFLLLLLQDVAYALTTSLDEDILADMGSFVDLYISQLSQYLKAKGMNIPEDLRKDFDRVWLDYARVIVTGLWKRLSPEQMERYKNVVGPSMINKNMKHIQFIIRRAHDLLH